MSVSGRLAVFLLLFFVLMLWNFPDLSSIPPSTSINSTQSFNKNDPAMDDTSWMSSQKLLPAELTSPRPFGKVDLTATPMPWDYPSVTSRPLENLASYDTSFSKKYAEQSKREKLESPGEDSRENTDDLYLTTNPAMFDLPTQQPQSIPASKLSTNQSQDMWVFT